MSETTPEPGTGDQPALTVVRMTSKVLSVRVDSELLDRLNEHAARRQVTVQDYVISLLVRDDFDERFTSAVEETERFYGGGQRASHDQDSAGGPVAPHTPGRPGGTPRPPGDGAAASSLGAPFFASPYLAEGGGWGEQADTDVRDGLGWQPGDTRPAGGQPGGWAY